MYRDRTWFGVCLVSAVVCGGALVDAQDVATRTVAVATANSETAAIVVPPADYVIGPEDQLSVTFFGNRDMSADVVVRPDGKISLPLINDIQAGGITPEELRTRVNTQAKRFVQEPNATVVVRQINSRKVSIIGAVERPGLYPLPGPTSVLHLIAAASGLKDYAHGDKIAIIRSEGGRQVTFKFNYKEVLSQRNLQQNIELRPGDIVVVP